MEIEHEFIDLDEFEKEKLRIFRLLEECLDLNRAKSSETLNVLQAMFARKLFEERYTYAEYCEVMDQTKEVFRIHWNEEALAID